MNDLLHAVRLAPLALAAASLASAAGAQTTDLLIPPGSVWTYLDDGSDQGTSWRDPGFDDAGWASGPAQLGYGDGDEATVISFGPDEDDKHITTYFRLEFPVANPGLYLNTNLRVQRDDGAVVYLNGVEVVRQNMPAGVVTSETEANSAMSQASEENFSWKSLDPNLFLTGTNLLAIEVHQSSPTSSDVSFDAQLIGSTDEILRRGPYLQVGTPTGVRVLWRTDLDTDSVVWYGDAPGNLTSMVSDATLSQDHDVEITGLSADTRYYYAVGKTGLPLVGADATHFFETAHATGSVDPFRVWVLGDSGTANGNADSVRDAYETFTTGVHTDLWMMLGDNAYPSGSNAQFQAAVFDTYPEMLKKSVLWLTRGNHEMSASVYFGLFHMPTAGEAGGMASGTEAYYSFDYGNVHFVCLDSEGSSRAMGGPMWTWLDSDLAATDQDWIVAFWHHPPYTKGSHDSDDENQLIQMRENFLPLLESGAVDLVLTGHSHSYERSFLIDGHYGSSETFVSSMKRNGGDGREDGDGAYAKGAGANAGAVYAVAGCSGKLGSGPLDHPAMFHSVVTLGSVVLDVDGSRLDVKFVDEAGQIEDYFTLLSDRYLGTYCIANPHSDGCPVQIGFSGTPSATDQNPFDITATGMIPGPSGILFYGYGPASFPFVGGLRCVAAPFRRTPPQAAGGAGMCGGLFGFDFNARIQSGVDAGLVPGAVVYCQYWFRDNQSPNGSGLSDALQFTIQP